MEPGTAMLVGSLYLWWSQLCWWYLGASNKRNQAIAAGKARESMNRRSATTVPG